MSVADEFDKRIENRDYEGALAILAKAWHSQYDTSFYLSNMGWTLNQLERPIEAASHLAKAISLFPDDAWNYSQIGYSYQLMDRYEDALNFYKKAIERGSDDAWVNSRIGYVLVELERYKEAIEYFENALMDNPDDSELKISLGNCYCYTRDFDRACEEWISVIRLHRDEGLIEACVLALFREDEFDKPKELLAYMPETSRRYYLDAIIAFEHDQFEEAIAIAEKSLSEDVDHTGLRQLMSDAYFRLGDEENAHEQLRVKREYWIKGIDKQEEDLGLLRHIAMTSLTLREYDVAEEYILRAIKLDENDPLSIYFYCNTLVYNQKYEEALPWFKKLRELDKESLTPESMYNEAYSLFYLAHYDEAIKVVNKFRELTPEDLDGYMLELVAESYYNTGKYAECVKEALNSLALDSSQLSVYRLMANANENLKDFKAAAASYLAAAERNLMDEDFYEYAIKALKRMKEKQTLKKVKEYWKKTN